MRHRGLLGLVFAAMLGLLAPAVTRADLLVYATNSTASAGGTGSFEVVVQNTSTDGTSYNISSFNTLLEVTNGTGLTFTGADGSTTSFGYIFGSVQFAPLGVVVGDTITLSDYEATSFVTLAAGQSLGLGNVTYSLAPGAPLDSINPIVINFGLTQIYDDSNPALEITLNTPQGGAVTVTASAVPEPGTIVLAGLVSSLGGVCVYKRKRTSRVVA